MICKAICRDCQFVKRSWNPFIYLDPDVWRCKAFFNEKIDCVGGPKGKKLDWCWKHNRDGNCEKFKVRE